MVSREENKLICYLYDKYEEKGFPERFNTVDLIKSLNIKDCSTINTSEFIKGQGGNWILNDKGIRLAQSSNFYQLDHEKREILKFLKDNERRFRNFKNSLCTCTFEKIEKELVTNDKKVKNTWTLKEGLQYLIEEGLVDEEYIADQLHCFKISHLGKLCLEKKLNNINETMSNYNVNTNVVNSKNENNQNLNIDINLVNEIKKNIGTKDREELKKILQEVKNEKKGSRKKLFNFLSKLTPGVIKILVYIFTDKEVIDKLLEKI